MFKSQLVFVQTESSEPLNVFKPNFVMVIHRQKLECYVKQMSCYLQGQGPSKDLALTSVDYD